MATIKTYPLQSSAILRINSEKDLIDVSPPYQRKGEIWSLEKRQLLIDSILNDYDIPKIYFYVLPRDRNQTFGENFLYAVIDGRQRLEAIWDFINGEFPLSEDFKYLKDESIKGENLTYPELAQKYPRLKIIFDSFVLPIVLVETEELDLIEDMFSRLNEAVPLNSAEKRNAFGGAASKLINSLSEHDFFKNKVKFLNNRYQHKEVIARLIFIEYSLMINNKIIDTKKPYLDNLVKEFKDLDESDELKIINEEIRLVLGKMCEIFSDNDSLLRSQAYVPIYYLVFKQAIHDEKTSLLGRQKFLQFQDKIKDNKILAEKDISKADFDFLEFDRLSQQGTNDASSIKERVSIMSLFLGIRPEIVRSCK